MQGTVTIPKVQLFRAGNYGDKGVYTEADIKRLAASYDPKNSHEAPVTIDHKQEGPRFGRVLSVYADGDILMGDLEVFDEFAQVLKRGGMDKRSIELYRDKDGRATGVRALTFLGAQPPEVKGLESLPAFSDALQYISFQEADIMADNTQDAAILTAIKDAVTAAVKEAMAAKVATIEVETEEMSASRKPKMMEGDETKEVPLAPAVKAKVEDEIAPATMSESAKQIVELQKTVADLKEQADAARFAAARLDREAKREKYVAQFSDRLTADSKAAVETLFDAVYTLAPVKFGEGTKSAVDVLTSLVTAIQPHKLGTQVAASPAKFGEESTSAHEAHEREMGELFDRAKVEFSEGKTGAASAMAHFEHLAREARLAKKGN